MQLPYSTTQLMGIGGRLRTSSDQFVVDEAPLYAPCGEGQHLYLNLTKTEMTTKEVQRQLMRLAGNRESDVGFAGMKDKYARTTQTFSVVVEHRSDAAIAELVARITEALPVTVNWATRHTNKLKLGHLLGNRFRITVTELAVPVDEALRRAAAVASELARVGAPNYFGPQRFGLNGANAATGLAVLQGKKYVRDRWLRRFLVSAYQSSLCNAYLAERLRMGLFDRLLLGDVAKKVDTGGLFVVEDVAQEQPRYERNEISFTAPLFGVKMRSAAHEAAALEDAVLAGEPVGIAEFARAKVDGTRRLGRLLVTDLRVEPSHDPEGLIVEFFLPKGAFATTVLRELMKVDVLDVPESDDE